MSKYTRSNKINHYHDSKTMIRRRASSKQETNLNIRSRIAPSSSISSIDRIENRRIVVSGGAASELDLDADSALVGHHQIAKRNDTNGCKTSTNRKFPPQHHAHRTLKQLAFFATFILAAWIVVCLEVRGVSSLNCYHCSSVDNPGCDEPFTGRANYSSAADTDCEKHIGRPAKVCRKIVQYIEDKKVVIRSCGYIDEHEGKDRKPMCYKRSGTFAIMMESCNCYEDNCNHSASLVPSNISLLLAGSFSGAILLLSKLVSSSAHLIK